MRGRGEQCTCSEDNNVALSVASAFSSLKLNDSKLNGQQRFQGNEFQNEFPVSNGVLHRRKELGHEEAMQPVERNPKSTEFDSFAQAHHRPTFARPRGTGAFLEIDSNVQKRSGVVSGSFPVLVSDGVSHPISTLLELCDKMGWNGPLFYWTFEIDSSSQMKELKRLFRYKVIVNGAEYQTPRFMDSKKQAKRSAATACLQSLGVIPVDKHEEMNKQQNKTTTTPSDYFQSSRAPYFPQQDPTETAEFQPKFLTKEELMKGPQAWATPNQLLNANKVNSVVGKSILEKMGWKDGDGLGKTKSGQVQQPLALKVKSDRRGLGCVLDNRKPQTAKLTGGKNPISVLMELCDKNKWSRPQFKISPTQFSCKVVLNGVEYASNVPMQNKKLAKAHAAQLCLESLGHVVPPKEKTNQRPSMQAKNIIERISATATTSNQGPSRTKPPIKRFVFRT